MNAHQYLEQRGLLDDFKRMALASHVTLEDVIGKSRERHISLARYLIVRWLREEIGWGWMSIGRAFDRDHSTMMALYKSHSTKDAA